MTTWKIKLFINNIYKFKHLGSVNKFDNTTMVKTYIVDVLVAKEETSQDTFDLRNC